MTRSVRTFAIAAALTALLAACGGDDTTTPSAGGTTPGSTSSADPITNKGTKDVTAMSSFTMELDDRYFNPTFLKVQSGQALNIELENEGDLPHTFTITALNVDQQVDPGGRKEIDITLPAGTTDIAFFCKFHGAGGMRGAFFFGSAPSATQDSGGGYGY